MEDRCFAPLHFTSLIHKQCIISISYSPSPARNSNKAFGEFFAKSAVYPSPPPVFAHFFASHQLSHTQNNMKGRGEDNRQ